MLVSVLASLPYNASFYNSYHCCYPWLFKVSASRTAEDLTCSWRKHITVLSLWIYCSCYFKIATVIENHTRPFRLLANSFWIFCSTLWFCICSLSHEDIVQCGSRGDISRLALKTHTWAKLPAQTQHSEVTLCHISDVLKPNAAPGCFSCQNASPLISWWKPESEPFKKSFQDWNVLRL